VIELRLEVNAPVRVCEIILDNIGEYFSVANDCQNLVQRIDGGNEKADFLDGARVPSGRDEITRFNRPQNYHECSGSEVGKQFAVCMIWLASICCSSPARIFLSYLSSRPLFVVRKVPLRARLECV
jgi:hypothetical protein